MNPILVPMQPKQAELYNLAETSEASVIGVGGSKGSAKSHGARAVMLLRRLKYEKTAGLMFRRKMKQLRETHLENGYFKTYPFMRDWWQESKKQILLPNGSRIVFGIAEHEDDINDFQGHEYMDVMPDEATRCSEMMLIKLNECRRWTGKFGGKPIPDWLCKTFWFMNPGGIGHSYIRRLMYKKEFHGNEDPANYTFLQAFAWDNIEWCWDALERLEGLTGDCQGKKCRTCAACVYYSWTSQQRFDFFIANTKRGKELNALPPRLRSGWLLGKWDEFAGQFYDIWDEDRFVRRCQPDRDWHTRWLGIDWGFQHPMSCHWMARAGAKTKIYRERVDNLHSARAQAQQIVDMTPPEERRLIDAIYLSPDAFQKRSEQDSFAELMGQVFRANGMPWPSMADDDRVHGAQCMYDLMKSDEIEIDPSCRELINVIPMICTEEDDPQEIEKFDGDDAWDSARYGLKSRMAAGQMPVTEAAEIKVAEFAKGRGKTVEELDINTVAQLHRRATAVEQLRRSRRRGGLGRIWRPQSA
jgi:phage terminase large subunit